MTHVPPEPYRIKVILNNQLSDSRGSNGIVILGNNFGLVVDIFVRFKFSTTNNQVEYEALF